MNMLSTSQKYNEYVFTLKRLGVWHTQSEERSPQGEPSGAGRCGVMLNPCFVFPQGRGHGSKPPARPWVQFLLSLCLLPTSDRSHPALTSFPPVLPFCPLLLLSRAPSALQVSDMAGCCQNHRASVKWVPNS